MIRRRMLAAKYIKRYGRETYTLLSNRIIPYHWNYIGTSYDHDTGVAKLFINTRLVAEKKIGKIQLATNADGIAGAKPKDRKRFRGMLSCVQIYKDAMRVADTIVVRNRCFKGGKKMSYSILFVENNKDD